MRLPAHAALHSVPTSDLRRRTHETAKRTMVVGLRDLGIFRGDVDGLLERGAHAIFFPHGIGHLLGLDVHDMEDLGDRAGYAPGRSRSKNFGDRYLRLDRDLAPGMAVTIEPWFYQVPDILRDKRIAGGVGDDLRRKRRTHERDKTKAGPVYQRNRWHSSTPIRSYRLPKQHK